MATPLTFSPSNMKLPNISPSTKMASPTSLSLHTSSQISRKTMKVYCQRPETTGTGTKRLPPGPMKLPVIGNLLNLIGAEPHHALAQLAREYGPLMHLQLGEISAVVVSNPKMAQEIMKTHDLIFANRPELLASKIITYGGKDIVFSPLGEYWKQMKRVCLVELLGPKRVESFRQLREDEVEKFIQSIRLSAGKSINLTERVFQLINDVICKAAFGDECEDQDLVIALTKEASVIAGGFGIADLFPSVELFQVISGTKGKLEYIRDELSRVFGNIIDEHRVFGNIIDEHKKKLMRESSSGIDESEKEDLVDVLLKLQGSGRLECPITSENLKAVIVDLFIAGTDTSSTTVEWAMSEMMKNPRVLKKAQEEVRKAFKGKKVIGEEDVHKLTYLQLVLKETLRLHPPGPLLLPRESTKTCEIDGYQIPIKTKVIVNAWAIGRDPEAWEEANRFKPERFMDSEVDFKGMDFEFIPFGAGRRICPGIAFGLANMELCLARLLYHFEWKFPNGITSKDFDMTECFGATVGRKNNLYLIPTLYETTDEDHHSPQLTEEIQVKFNHCNNKFGCNFRCFNS
ncbi:desmethyl-deoxy-podophyllotoxin synthase-like [Euphorbia lathyris]|uniref:desmethyl-deoxy-podophyllotoxin synthase-like n=1 Tax=Euphorbia lathyris TaxID=212925 RepID=UPI003313B6C5